MAIYLTKATADAAAADAVASIGNATVKKWMMTMHHTKTLERKSSGEEEAFIADKTRVPIHKTDEKTRKHLKIQVNRPYCRGKIELFSLCSTLVFSVERIPHRRRRSLTKNTTENRRRNRESPEGLCRLLLHHCNYCCDRLSSKLHHHRRR